MTEKKDHLMDAAFQYASIGIVVISQEGDIELINPFAQHLFGYTKKEITGKKIEWLIPERFRKGHTHHRDNFIRSPQKGTMCSGREVVGVKKDGKEFPVEISLDHYVIAFVRDITLRKQKEEEIIKMNEKLEAKVEERTHVLKDAMKKLEVSKAELMNSLEKEKDLSELKSRFVTMASHEFRTPLSTVLSSAYLLEKYCSTEDQPKRKKHIERIISSVNMLTDILNDFLSVGKIEEGKITVKPAVFNIREHIHGITGEMKSLFKKGQHVLYEHHGGEIVMMDTAILKHIVMNLLSNATKFSPEDSVIRIKSETIKDRLLLSIRDQGIGIPKEDQKHLFERFHRGSNVTNIQGTGLGLHIVAKYTELLKGKIKCKSELEKGTEFVLQFELPHEEQLYSATDLLKTKK